MPRTPPTARPARTRLGVALVGLLALALNACGTSKSQRPDPMPEWAADSEFGFSSQAVDPADADKAAGYGRWRAKPETEGTASPLAPDRRAHGWGAANQGIE